MTQRSAVFTGSANAAWPNLSNGDTWATGTWNVPTPETVQIQSGLTPTIVVNGSGVGTVTNTWNISPAVGERQATSTTAASTLLSGTQYYSVAASLTPSDSTLGHLNLIAVSTTSASAHFHRIYTTTGGWAYATISEVTTQTYNVGGVFYRQTVYAITSDATHFDAGAVTVGLWSAAVGGTAVTGTGMNSSTLVVTGVNTATPLSSITQVTTATSTTGQPAITLASNFTRYNSTMFGFISKAVNATTAATSTGTKTVVTSDDSLKASQSYGTPSNASGLFVATQGTTSATVKTSKTITAGWTNTTTYWGAIAFEILSSNTSDTYTVRSRDYVYTKLANTKTYKDVEVFGTVDNGLLTATGSLIARYVSATYTSWLSADAIVSGGLNYKSGGTVYINEKGANEYNWTSLAVGYGISMMNGRALRVRHILGTGGIYDATGGGLWVSAKFWNTSLVAEPDWPATSATASSKSVNNGTVSPDDPFQWAILNVFIPYNSSTAVADSTLNGNTAGLCGLSYLYPASNAGYLSSGTLVQPASGAATLSWSSYSDRDPTSIISDLPALTGSSTFTSAATNIVIGDLANAFTGTGQSTGALSADSTIIPCATATLENTSSVLTAAAIIIDVESISLETGNGTLSADATNITVAQSTLSGNGSLTVDHLEVAFSSADLDVIDSDIEATGILIFLGEATLSGASTFESVDSTVIRFAAADLSGVSGGEQTTGIIVSIGTATLSGVSDLTSSGFLPYAQAVLTGTSDLSATHTAILFETVTLTASSSLSVSAETAFSVTMAAVGALSAVATRTLVASANLTGTSGGSSTVGAILVAASTLTGTSSGTGSATHVNVVTSTLTGTGALSCDGTHVNIASATCSGLAAMETDSTHIVVTGGALSGLSSGSNSYLLNAFTSATLQSASTFSSQMIALIMAAPGSLQGASGIVVSGKAVHPIPDTLRNTITRKRGNALSSIISRPYGMTETEASFSSRKVVLGVLSSAPVEVVIEPH